MTENKSKYGNIAAAGGGRNVGRTLKAQMELLEEVETYRAIGTVEGLESLKALCKEQEKLIEEKNKQISEYEAIGTVEEFQSLKAENAKLHNEAQAERVCLAERDAEVRVKAIDDFMKKICEKYTEEEKRRNYKQYCCDIKNELADIAEQMKGGTT